MLAMNEIVESGILHCHMGTFALPPVQPKFMGALCGANDASIPYHCSDPALDTPEVR